MPKAKIIQVKETLVHTMRANDFDYVCITDIARLKNPVEPKDVVKNWMRSRNTLEYLGLWEKLYNPDFKGVDFDPLLQEAGSNAFTMSPSRWVEVTNAIGIITKNGQGGGTYAHNIPQGERLVKLNQVAIRQMQVLENTAKEILKLEK